MSQPASKSSSKLKRAAIFGAVAAVVCLALVAVAYWLVVPGIASQMVRNKLDAVEKRAGLTIETEDVSTSGISSVTISGFRVVDPDTDKPLAEVASITAGVDAAELVMGNRQLSAIEVRDATLHVHRRADGSTNLEAILARRAAEAKDTPEPANAPSKTPAKTDDTPSILRALGGEWPDVEVDNARIVLSADPKAKPWPVDEVVTERLELDSNGKTADMSADIAIARGEANPRWSIPTSARLEAHLAAPLLASTGSLTFETPVEVVGVGPLPFVRAGIGGVALEDDNTISLRGLSVGVQGDGAPTRLLDIEEIATTLRSLEPTLDNLRPLEVRITSPVVHLDYDEQSASGLRDLWHLARAPLAHHVHGRAKDVVRRITEEKGIEFEEKEDQGGGLVARLSEIDWPKFLAEQAPQNVSIEGAAVQMTDARGLTVEPRDETLALRDGSFEFSHRAIHGELVFAGGFLASGDQDASRGSVDGEFRWNYRNGKMGLDASVDALSLPWVVQMLAARFDDQLRAGTLRADLTLKRESRRSPLEISGMASVEELDIFLAPVTEEPIEDLTASYVFELSYDPRAEIPAPVLLKPKKPKQPAEQASNDKKRDEETDQAPQPPEKGALVFTRGEVRVNGVEGTFRPALYGLDGLARLPARLDLAAELPGTPVQALFDAVPDAIKGPLTGTKMAGSFSWAMTAEVPLYDAGEMKWKSTPKLEAFALDSMPEQVDVRKMYDEFDLAIYDPVLEWERTVTVPEMRPVPLTWLVQHSGLTQSEFEDRRRDRQWPPSYRPGGAPDANGDGLPDRLAPHAPPWPDPEPTVPTSVEEELSGLGDSLSEQTKPTPPPKKKQKPSMVKWKDETKEHPYGPYVYVPLQHISPWLVRAAMTTEDNSFFEHHGFNWFALKDSVEDNIEAGGYVRGASTISMQLVKNVFLNRKKVLARKIQEAFLVWLMEDVVDVPKARILELYFNVIEYGPGIYGIHDASVHYFGKRPDQLTLTEVAWLVSIVPNPKKYHFYYERGAISDGWFRHMLRYIRVMHNRGRVTEWEYELAKQQKPAFYKPADGEPMMRIERSPEQIEAIEDDQDGLSIPGLQDFFQ